MIEAARLNFIKRRRSPTFEGSMSHDMGYYYSTPYYEGGTVDNFDVPYNYYDYGTVKSGGSAKRKKKKARKAKKAKEA